MKQVALRRDVIYRRMLRRNLSLRKLAERAGISAPHLSQLLNGRRAPGPETRQKLMGALDVSPYDWDDLFEETGE